MSDNIQIKSIKQQAINEIIRKLQETTPSEPYMTNALQRVALAIPKIFDGRYTSGSV